MNQAEEEVYWRLKYLIPVRSKGSMPGFLNNRSLPLNLHYSNPTINHFLAGVPVSRAQDKGQKKKLSKSCLPLIKKLNS